MRVVKVNDFTLVMVVISVQGKGNFNTKDWSVLLIMVVQILKLRITKEEEIHT